MRILGSRWVMDRHKNVDAAHRLNSRQIIEKGAYILERRV